MQVREIGFYYLIPRRRRSAPVQPVVGYWDGQFWKIFGSVVQFRDGDFAEIGDGPEHLRPKPTPPEQEAIRGTFIF